MMLGRRGPVAGTRSPRRTPSASVVKLEGVPPSESSESKPKSKAKKAAWKDLSPAEMATHLLATPTLADRTWTGEQRVTGEKRDAFIRRILLGETGETSEIVVTDETAAQASRSRLEGSRGRGM